MRRHSIRRMWHAKSLVALGAVLGLSLALCSMAHAESVALAGMLGSKALLVVDGSTPKTVAVGESLQGVKVISTSGDQVVIERQGKRQTLRVGESPISLGSSAGGGGTRGNRIVLKESGGGHFVTAGQINGRTVQLMVDTGATFIALGTSDAERLGLNYKAGQPVRMSTANGDAMGYHLKLSSVRIGDVEVYEIDAVVTPMGMPNLLLGNSFLSHFQMKRDNNVMTLDKRY